MRSTLYRALNSDAKAWPYYVGNRKKQRECIRANLDEFRGVLGTKNAYGVISYQGEFSLKYVNKSGYDTSMSGATVERANRYIHAGVPVIDCRTADYQMLYKVVVQGPMAAVGDMQIDETCGSMSFRPLWEVINLHELAGCTIYNHPDPHRALAKDALIKLARAIKGPLQ